MLVAGGYGSGSSPLNSAELYDPSIGSWAATGSMIDARAQSAAALLPDGTTLVAGGVNDCCGLATAEIFDPGLGYLNAWRPSVGPLSEVDLGDPLSLSGSQLQGLSEASSGVTQSSPTNYPVVQLHRLGNDQVTTVDTTAWTATSLSTVPVSGLPPGYALLTVFANGIPSVAQVVSVATASTPAAQGQSATVSEATPKTINLQASDVDGESLTFAIASGPSSGTLSQIGTPSCSFSGGTSSCTASVTYTPKTGFLGIDSFAFTASDGKAASPPATVLIDVVNVAPTVTPPVNQSAPTGVSTSFALGSFADPGNDGPFTVDVTWNDGTAHSTFTQSRPGTIASQSHTYASPGEYGVIVGVTDKNSGTGTATFQIAVGLQATSLALASGGASGTYGQMTSLSATLTANGVGLVGKTVSFTLNGAAVGSATTDASGVASLSGVSLGTIPVGTYPTGVGVSFAGDSQDAASSTAGPLTVTPASTAASLSASASCAPVGSTVTIIVDVAPSPAGSGGFPTGSVTLFDNGVSLAIGSVVGGVSTFQVTTLGVGTHALTASYQGDENYLGSSTTAPLSETIATSPTAEATIVGLNGTVQINVPAGAFAVPAVISIASASPAANLGAYQQIEGIALEATDCAENLLVPRAPVTLSVTPTADQLGNLNGGLLRLFAPGASGAWTVVPATLSGDTVTVELTSLGSVVLAAPPAGVRVPLAYLPVVLSGSQ